jgi:3-hydroxypropanoate dehydrogenase
MTAVDTHCLDVIFREARTLSHWQDKPVDDTLLRAVFDLAKMGATSANCSPARFVFIRTPAAKQRLAPCLAEGNLAKTMAAPVTVVVAYDLDFPDTLPTRFPHTDARSWFTGNDPLIQSTAFRNSSLQGAYLMLAARALGLDCGPMSGFDNAMLDAEFFPGGRVNSNFLVNLGYGDRSTLHPRPPRPAFDEVCQLL